MSGQAWLGSILCTGKWVKKIVFCGGVFDLAVEQPQLFRKLPKNKKQKLVKRVATLVLSKGWLHWYLSKE